MFIDVCDKYFNTLTLNRYKLTINTKTVMAIETSEFVLYFYHGKQFYRNLSMHKSNMYLLQPSEEIFKTTEAVE